MFILLLRARFCRSQSLTQQKKRKESKTLAKQIAMTNNRQKKREMMESLWWFYTPQLSKMRNGSACNELEFQRKWPCFIGHASSCMGIWFGVKNQTNDKFCTGNCILRSELIHKLFTQTQYKWNRSVCLSVRHKYVGNPFAEVYLRNNPSNQTDIKKLILQNSMLQAHVLWFLCAPVFYMYIFITLHTHTCALNFLW